MGKEEERKLYVYVHHVTVLQVSKVTVWVQLHHQNCSLLYTTLTARMMMAPWKLFWEVQDIFNSFFPFNPSSSSSSLSKSLTCAFCWEEGPDSGCVGCCTAAPQSKTTPNTHTHVHTHASYHNAYYACLSSLSLHSFSSSLTLFPRWFRVGLCPQLVNFVMTILAKLVNKQVMSHIQCKYSWYTQYNTCFVVGGVLGLGATKAVARIYEVLWGKWPVYIHIMFWA